jgi:hypothetical protein
MKRLSFIVFASLCLVAASVVPAAAIPGDNSKYVLAGNAFRDKSPTNDDDQVVRFTTTEDSSLAVVIRKLNTTVGSLDGLLSVDWYFEGQKTCGAASPRYSLFIDENGNGIWEPPAERAIFGYIGPLLFGTGCLPNTWHHENLTDERPRWDLSQISGAPTPPGGQGGLFTWDQVEAFFLLRPANETVVFAKLVEDSCSFSPTACGTSFYDTVELGDREMTLENWSDASTGCSQEFESAGIDCTKSQGRPKNQ